MKITTAYGIALDTPDDLKLTLVWRNQYFDLENALAGRTSGFTLPATAKNLNLLGFPTIPTQGGGVMRSTMAVTIQEGVTQIQGIMYAKQASRTEGVQCVVTYGEVTELLRIKQAGNIGEYMNFADKVDITATPTPVTPANFNYAEYDNSVSGNFTSLRMPTVKLDYLLQSCANHFNVGCDIVTDAAIVCNTLNKGDVIGTGSYLYNTYNIASINTYVKQCRVTAVDVVGTQRTLWGLRFLRPCVINFSGANPWTKVSGVFPSGVWSQGIKILRQPAVLLDTDPNITILYPFATDYGDWLQSGQTYSEDQYIDVEWEVKAGDVALFYQENVNYTTTEMRYYSLRANQNINVTINIKDSGGVVGAEYFLQPNLPKCNYLDLLRMAAVWDGGTLIYEGGRFETGRYNFDTANARNLHPIDAEVVYRCEVGDFAQENTLKFDSNDEVSSETKAYTEAAYYISNTLLEKTKELFTFKFSQANISPIDNSKWAQVQCVKIEADGTLSLAGMSKAVICGVAKLGIFPFYEVLRVTSLPTNQTLQDICTLATSAEMHVQQDISEFMSIDRNTAYYYAGCYWCVREAQWSDGVTKLKLQRYR